MKICFQARFRRACEALSAADQAALLRALLELGSALGRHHEHFGLGLRKLHPSRLWEIRVGLTLRAVFGLAGDEATFVFLGSHDEVQRFLKSL